MNLLHNYIYITGIIFNIILGIGLILVLTQAIANIFYGVKFKKLDKIQNSEEFKKVLNDMLKGVPQEEIKNNDGTVTTNYNFENKQK